MVRNGDIQMVINGQNATTTKCHYKTNVSTTGKNKKKCFHIAQCLNFCLPTSKSESKKKFCLKLISVKDKVYW